MVFTSKTFHLWPFGEHGRALFFRWRGFIETNEVTISDSEITIDWKKGKETFPVKDLEFCIKKNRWFGLGNTRYYVGLVTEKDKPKDWKPTWVWTSKEYFYIPPKKVNEFDNALKEQQPVCFGPNGTTIYTQAPWYRVDMLISGNRNSLWANTNHIFTSNNVTRFLWTGLDINKVKYFYTRGLITKNLYVGSDHSLVLKNVLPDSVKTAKQHLLTHGANFASDADVEYSDTWTPKVIFSPKLWFAHSSVGFTKDGLIFKQKTFKTDDNIFLPWKKINMATEESSWMWWFTKEIRIYGEQNIFPLRRYPKASVNAIMKKLEQEGIRSFDGKAFQASYHTSWFGILLCWVTLSIYHWIVVSIYAMAKRNTLLVGDKKMSWDGKLFYYTTDDMEKWRTKPTEEKKMSTFVAKNEDVYNVWFIKKKWYHLWGYEVVSVWPNNIRAFDNRVDGAGANQHSVHYFFTLNKVWSWDSKAIKDEYVKQGYRFDKIDKENEKLFKKWAKWYVKEYY